jgi:hypothetical protein
MIYHALVGKAACLGHTGRPRFRDKGRIMSELVRYRLDDGTEVTFEVDPSEGYVPAGVTEKIVGEIRQAAKPAVAAARTVLDLVEEAKPHEAEVTFSLKVSGDVNWVVGKAASEGTFQVRLLWKSTSAE